ncbi:hypothetical protein [Paenibacillus silagei]|uniref:Uncharacterized protein n=1 Tax=Paenibacillus silagei TaxID=1670801 RepID=A0ABS4NXH7_9BACL|nr:hypothetical protein [Paenibacillus silagei]MBP2114769.1 hypothetical protein [Paenibacillus silagei]
MKIDMGRLTVLLTSLLLIASAPSAYAKAPDAQAGKYRATGNYVLQ